MAQLAWEKPIEKPKNAPQRKPNARMKFAFGGGLLIAAVAGLLLLSTFSGARFFVTVDEVVADSTYIGQSVRLTGAVIGESIVYVPDTGDLSFTIAHLPTTNDDLALALHEATKDLSRTRLSVQMTNQALPDLLQNEAQAIVTGKMGEDGVFYADELLLKCPSRFEEGGPTNLATDNAS